MNITTQDRIVAAANRHGWSVTGDGWSGAMEFNKGTRHVRIMCDPHGRVVSASRGNRGTGWSFCGTGKADQVIARLEQARWA